MGLIRFIKEKDKNRKIDLIKVQAVDSITLLDFESVMYIAFNGIPLIPVEEDMTPKEIIEELHKVRNNFINARVKELC